MLILSRERPEKDVANICNRRIRHFAKIGSRRRCLRVLPLRTICSWSIVSLTHILTISHGGEFISSVCYLCRKTSAKKEIFPFSFFKGFRGNNCPENTHLVDIWYIKGIPCFFSLYKHTATLESFCGFCKTLVGVWTIWSSKGPPWLVALDAAAVSPLEDRGPWDQEEIQFRHTPAYCSGDKQEPLLKTQAHIVLLADEKHGQAIKSEALYVLQHIAMQKKRRKK